MSKIVLIIIVIVVIVAGALFILFKGPNLSKFEYLKDPQITQKANQKVIQVTAKGDPDIIGKEAFKLLFNKFFSIKGKYKNVSMAAPKARWPKSLEVKKTDWIGIYALPVPDDVNEPSEQKDGMKVETVIWEYGTVAEILHKGPYTDEPPTVDRLKKFIDEKGYKIVGDYEEEYLRGQGLLPVSPKNYYTIIRYRVIKK